MRAAQRPPEQEIPLVLSKAYGLDVVDQIRGLTRNITEVPVLDHERWCKLVRRCGADEPDVARKVARVDRRVTLAGLAGRFGGEALRADQHPGLRELIDRMVAGENVSPERLDLAVDQAAQWSARIKARGVVIRQACEMLPRGLGIAVAGLASEARASRCPAGSPDEGGLVPPEPFRVWCAKAAEHGDVDALIVTCRYIGVGLDAGQYNENYPPSAVPSPAANTARMFTWVFPANTDTSRDRAGRLLRDPMWAAALTECPPVEHVVAQIARGGAVLVGNFKEGT